jgi:hypothetical protein
MEGYTTAALSSSDYREKLTRIETDFALLDSKLKKFVGRSKDILFKYDKPPHYLQTNYASDYSNKPSYSMQVFKHSGNEYLHEGIYININNNAVLFRSGKRNHH